MASIDKKNMPVAQQDKQSGKRFQPFMRRIRERFFLRFHMSLILMATALSGLLATKLLLILDVDNIVIRYPAAVVVAYLAFFLFVKLWLAYMTASNAFKGPDTGGDVLSDLPNLSGGGSGGGADLPGFRGGGGGTGGGGGATGSFDGPTTNVQAIVVPSSSGGGGGSGSGIGDALGGLGDIDDGWVILVAIGALLAAVFGSAFYLIYIAPHILSEAAFDFLLGSSLIRSYKKVNHPDWIGSVFKDTYKPFVFVLLVSFGAAWVIHAYAPGITSITDLIKH
jgi:hypothetical protein